MKTNVKVIMTITVLLTISTIVSAIPVKAVKSGEAIKIHMFAEGDDLWDPSTTVMIKANIEHDYTSAWLKGADFKKFAVDAYGEEVMLFHGKLKEGSIFYLDFWQSPYPPYLVFHSLWYIIGTGIVKTQTDIYKEATIEFLFSLDGSWAWAGFTDPESGVEGPDNPLGRRGTLTILTEVEEIGANQFDFIKQEHNMILDTWISGDPRIIRPGRTLNYADTIYVIIGMAQSPEEKKDKEFFPPFDMQITLDEMIDVELKSFWWYDKYGLRSPPGETLNIQVFYHIYEPYTLPISSLGEHTLDHAMSFYNGVGNERTITYHDEPQWLFYVDYWI